MGKQGNKIQIQKISRKLEPKIFLEKNTNLDKINTIKLVPDDCEEQNKNSIVVGMVCTLLDKNAPPAVKKVSLLFPVVGHSYILLIAFLAESKERLRCLCNSKVVS